MACIMCSLGRFIARIDNMFRMRNAKERLRDTGARKKKADSEQVMAGAASSEDDQLS